MRFSYQKRVPFHIEHYFETRNDPRARGSANVAFERTSPFGSKGGKVRNSAQSRHPTGRSPGSAPLTKLATCRVVPPRGLDTCGSPWAPTLEGRIRLACYFCTRRPGRVSAGFLGDFRLDTLPVGY